MPAVWAKLSPMEPNSASNVRMGRLARYTGPVVLALILAGIAYGGHIVLKTKRYNTEAAAFVRDGVAAMASQWSSAELIQRASPAWLTPADYPGVERLFGQLARLGKLKGLGQPTGRVGNGPYPGTRIVGGWAEYTVRGEFDAGPCEFRMILERAGDHWRIVGLDLVSETLTSKGQ